MDSFLDKVYHMDFSVSLIGVLLVTFSWRQATFCLERKGTIVPKWGQYYTILYVLLGLLLILNYIDAWKIVVDSKGLDSDEILNAAWGAMNLHVTRNASFNVTHNMTQMELDWSNEADLKDYPFLKVFSFSAPFWALATYGLCAWHTYKYVSRMPQKLMGDTERDKTIIILALPFVYGFMSLWSVMHAWQITNSSMTMAINFLGGRVHEAVKLLMLAYEANFAVADFYEAFALWTFAEVTLGVLRTKSLKLERRHHKRQAQIMEASITTQEERQEEAEFSSLELTTRKTTQKLAMIGVRYFCISCLVSACCAMAPIELYYFGGERTEMNFVHVWLTKVSEASESGVLTGMGLIASFCAIENIIIVEHQFGETFFHDFQATTKFWSTKVLVSLVFFQSSLASMPPFSSLSLTRRKLVHASLLSCECFFIALFHFKAWGENEKWYKTFGNTVCEGGQGGERMERLISDGDESDDATP